MIETGRFHRVFDKMVLRSLLPHVVDNKQALSALGHLEKVSRVVWDDKVLSRDSVTYCPLCKREFDNLLLFVLHVEMQHAEKIQVIRYLIKKDVMRVEWQEQEMPVEDQFVHHEGMMMLSRTAKQSPKILVKELIRKIQKAQDKHKRTYYHSNDIFREIGTDSENEDSEADIKDIEADLERFRITDFTDVSQPDQEFFLAWNHFIKNEKKAKEFVKRERMAQILIKFAGIARAKDFDRMRLAVHAFTLWSAGKIESMDVHNCMVAFDLAPSHKQ